MTESKQPKPVRGDQLGQARPLTVSERGLRNLPTLDGKVTNEAYVGKPQRRDKRKPSEKAEDLFGKKRFPW